jgi:MtaA/CmuA family methyltransferase
MMTSRERVSAMIAGQPVDRLPVMPITMMLAADQIGARYRDYATDHRVMVEAQIRTAERFGLDHVSGISDPAREAADLGATIKYFDHQPPAIDETHALLHDKSLLAKLVLPDPAATPRMGDRVRAMALFKERVGREKLIEGWIEGPCAQGADLRGINTLMFDFFDDPAFVHDLFAWVVELEFRFARRQVEAGADFIGIGDAAASLIGPRIYEEFVWPREKELIDRVHALGVPVRLHICGNTRPLLAKMGELGAEIVDLDFMVPLEQARHEMGPRQVLCGNLDPVRAVKESTPEKVHAALAACHLAAGPRYIVGAGCEIPRGTPPENLTAMAEYAKTAKVA